MADLTDVENALVNFALAACYPKGTGNPSVANVNIAIFPGWPNPADLDATLAAGNCYVSVYPSQVEVNTTRFPIDWQVQSIDTPTITPSIDDNEVTISGTVSSTVPQVVMVISNNVGYHYSVQITDTLETIATELAAIIPNASASSNVITISNCYRLASHVSVHATSIQETRRQKKLFQIIIWAPSQVIRTDVASAIDVYLSQITRFVLPDNYYAWLHYTHSIEIDKQEKQLCFRRDLFYQCEYATTVTQTDYTISDPFVNSITPVLNVTS